ncbi:ATP-dependent dethiobiotin synthetase BioD, partial [Aeromonas hydrophila]
QRGGHGGPLVRRRQRPGGIAPADIPLEPDEQGEWFLPLDRKHLLSDWVKQENMPVIMVVGAKLGCLNHALLTFAAIRNNNLPVAGWVINRLHGSMSHYQENLDTLRGLLPAPFLGEIPFVNNPLEADLRGRLDISPLL